MTVSVNIHGTTKAVATSYSSPLFDSVEFFADETSSVSMFLPYGTGQAVADAINAAIKPKETE